MFAIKCYLQKQQDKIPARLRQMSPKSNWTNNSFNWLQKLFWLVHHTVSMWHQTALVVPVPSALSSQWAHRMPPHVCNKSAKHRDLVVSRSRKAASDFFRTCKQIGFPYYYVDYWSPAGLLETGPQDSWKLALETPGNWPSGLLETSPRDSWKLAPGTPGNWPSGLLETWHRDS